MPDDVFQGTIRILREILPKWQISYSSADMTDVDAVRAAIRQNTRLEWLETLSNPMLKVTDVASISKLAHESGAVAVVDNTFVTARLPTAAPTRSRSGGARKHEIPWWTR